MRIVAISAAVLGAATMSVFLASCGGDARHGVLPGDPRAAGSARHTRNNTEQNGDGGCGACDCSNDPSNDGTLTPTGGDNACGGSSGPIGGNVGGGGGSDNPPPIDGGPNSGGGGGSPSTPSAPYLLALLPPARGAVCGTIVQSLPLDSNLPLGSTDKSTDVIQIWYLYEPTTLNPNPSASPAATFQNGNLIVGFVYLTAGNPATNQPGQYFVQSTGGDPSFVSSLVSNIPALGAPLNAIKNSTAGAFSQVLTSPEANGIFSLYPPKGKGKGSGPCFSSSLPESLWT